MPSKIEWTGSTWNPIVGCSIFSPGCKRCYAMRMAARLEAMGLPQYRGLTERSAVGAVWTGEVRFVESALTLPLRTRKPTTWFVNSMSDLFHEGVPDAWIDRIFAVMALCPQHTFQVLTKRSARMRAYMAQALGRVADAAIALRRSPIAVARGLGPSAIVPLPHVPLGRAWWPLPNVWLGVSAEDQRRADERVPDLLASPAAIRFVSAEPLLGPLHLAPYMHDSVCLAFDEGHCTCSDPREVHLDWIIVGGESGPDARPMNPAWAQAIRDQCAAAGVPFFFKQWGEWSHSEQTPAPVPGPHFFDEYGRPCGAGWHFWSEGDRGQNASIRVGKKAAGRLLDGVLHTGMPDAGARP